MKSFLPPASIFYHVVRWVVCILALAASSGVRAQSPVSAGMDGLVTNDRGAALADATVTAIHEPTATTYRATTRSNGTYGFRGLIVGGPYRVEVSAPGYAPTSRTDIVAALANILSVSFILSPEGAPVTLAAVDVQASRHDLAAAALGAGSLLSREPLETQPSIERSLADMVRTNPFVTLRGRFGDRQEPQIVAVGQNNRYNSIQLDGARINDQFGLNASGLQSFANPVSLEAIEQLSVEVSPYDIRQSGFTGASINATTRSGTNTFGGSAYLFYSDDDLQGPDTAGPSRGSRPAFSQKTYGATFGGPLLRDRLFFFLNYEKFSATGVAQQPGFTPAPADLAIIGARLAQLPSLTGQTLDFGSYGAAGELRQEDEKRLIKLDWNINEHHRLAVRYNDTQGEIPQFGRYSGTGTFMGVGGSLGPIASASTAFSSNFSRQERTEKVWAGQLFSQWTPAFKTELRYAKTSYDQHTHPQAVLPEIRIFGVAGTDRNGQAITDGVLVLGSEQFSQGTAVQVDTTSYSASGDYFWRQFTFSAGFDREESDFYNLFRQGSYGLFDYAMPTHFFADVTTVSYRTFYVEGTPPADVSDFATTGFFAQFKWDVSPRLTLLFGGRWDRTESDGRPPLNPAFVTAFGLRNDHTVDGTDTFSPRVGFNYTPDEDRRLQVRGGVGRFLGRAPWVFFSNAYGNSGVNRFGLVGIVPAAVPLSTYLRDDFDPARPIGVAASDTEPFARREINLLSEGLRMPSVWRSNLAVDIRLDAIHSVLSLEGIQTYTDQALFIDNLNLTPTTRGADGRQRFAGGATTPLARNTNFSNVLRVTNTSAGKSSYVSLSLDRPMRNRWAAHLGYTRGRSIEAQSFAHSAAIAGWSNHAVFNQNTVEPGRSDFEVRDRVLASYTHRFEFVRQATTDITLFYEGRTGNPYSFVYASDLNNDGVAGNDLIYVPTGIDDPRMDFSLLSPAQRDALLGYIANSPLDRFRGTYTPRNAFALPWVNRLDLRVAQRIPLRRPLDLEVFFDFINFGAWISRDLFGYVESLGDFNGVFVRRTIGPALYGPDGRIQPMAFISPADPAIDNVESRWRIQVGTRLRF